jgi:hypothetical protein
MQALSRLAHVLGTYGLYYLTEFSSVFIIPQQNIDMIKAEHQVNVLSEEDSIDMKTNEVCVLSGVAIQSTEPDISVLDESVSLN